MDSMRKNKDGMYLPKKNWKDLNEDTGEVRTQYEFVPFHKDEYTSCVFKNWHNLGYTSGFRLMVFIQCCCVADGHKEGSVSCFFVGDLLERMRVVFPRVAPSAVRGAVGELRKGGFIKKTDIRGKYMINPDYAINGGVLELAYDKFFKEGGYNK